MLIMISGRCLCLFLFFICYVPGSWCKATHRNTKSKLLRNSSNAVKKSSTKNNPLDTFESLLESKAGGGSVLSTDTADKLGLNSPEYLKKLGLKNISLSDDDSNNNNNNNNNNKNNKRTDTTYKRGKIHRKRKDSVEAPIGGLVISNDKADKLGLNSPDYLKKLGLKNISSTDEKEKEKAGSKRSEDPSEHSEQRRHENHHKRKDGVESSVALNGGLVISNDSADKLGLNSPDYLKQIGLKNISITDAQPENSYRRSDKSSQVKSRNNINSRSEKKTIHASHVAYVDDVKPEYDEFEPEFTFHYPTHEIPSENELSAAITGRKDKQKGVSILADEKKITSHDGMKLADDQADRLGLNSPDYLKKIGISDISISTGERNKDAQDKTKIEKPLEKRLIAKKSKKLKAKLHLSKDYNATKRSLPSPELLSTSSSSLVSMDTETNSGLTPQPAAGNSLTGDKKSLSSPLMPEDEPTSDEISSATTQNFGSTPNFDMNEETADKVLRQVDSMSGSTADTTGNILKGLTELSSHQEPEGSERLANEMPEEVQKELMQNAGDITNGARIRGQNEENESLQSQLSDIAAKESAASNNALDKQDALDSTVQKTLTNAAAMSPELAKEEAAIAAEKEQAMNTPTEGKEEQAGETRHFHRRHHGHHLHGFDEWGATDAAGCSYDDPACATQLTGSFGAALHQSGVGNFHSDCLVMDAGCHHGGGYVDDGLTHGDVGHIDSLNLGLGGVGGGVLGQGGGLVGHDGVLGGIAGHDGGIAGGVLGQDSGVMANGDGHIGGVGLTSSDIYGHSDLLNSVSGVGGMLTGHGVYGGELNDYGHGGADTDGVLGGSIGLGGAHGGDFASTIPTITDHHTGNLLDGLTHGDDLNFHGHVGGHDGFNAHFGNGWTPIATHNRHHYHHQHGHGHKLEPNFRFHYSTFEIPVHGDVVSEKDAKKIGLFDQAYLKKLGVWEDYRAGVSGGGGASGVGTLGGGGMGGGGGCMVPADIAFLFDGSNLGDKKEQYFRRYIAFAKQVVDYHPPSIEGYHYGAVLYSDSGIMQFDFEKSYDAVGVKTELNRIQLQDTKGKKMDEGLKTVKEQLFDRTSRDWVYKVLIVITDSKGDGDVEKPAQLLRDATVNIFAIGLDYGDSKADNSQLEKVASKESKNHVFQVEIENLLGAVSKVDHPKVLARIIPDHICRLDLVFVVDMKDKDATRMQHIKNFMKSSAAGLGMSEFGNHVGVVGYQLENAAKDGWDLESKRTYSEYSRAVSSLDQEAGKAADTGSALKIAADYFRKKKTEPHGGQFWRYINMTIIITDQALSGDYEKSAKEELRDYGVIVHSIGWGAAIAAGKETLYKASSIDKSFYVHELRDISMMVKLARQFSLYFGELMNGRQGQNRKILGGWEKQFAVASAVYGSGFSSGGMVTGGSSYMSSSSSYSSSGSYSSSTSYSSSSSSSSFSSSSSSNSKKKKKAKARTMDEPHNLKGKMQEKEANNKTEGEHSVEKNKEVENSSEVDENKDKSAEEKTANIENNNDLDGKNLASTYDDYINNDNGDSGKEFGFRASAPTTEKDKQENHEDEDEDEDKRLLEEEVREYSKNIKVGQSKPNITIDKTDVEGGDSKDIDQLSGEKSGVRDDDDPGPDNMNALNHKGNSKRRQLKEKTPSTRQNIKENSLALKNLVLPNSASNGTSTQNLTQTPSAQNSTAILIAHEGSMTPANTSASALTSNSSKPFQNQNFTTNDFRNATKTLNAGTEEKASSRNFNTHLFRTEGGVLKNVIAGKRERLTMKDHIKNFLTGVIKPSNPVSKGKSKRKV